MPTEDRSRAVDMKRSPEDQPHVALVFKQLRASGGAEQMASIFIDVFRSLDVRLSVVARHLDGTPTGFEFHRVNPPHIGRAGRATGFARAACRRLSELGSGLVLSQEHMPCCHVYRAGGGAHAEWLRQRRRLQGSLRRAWERWDPHQRAKLTLERATYESPVLRSVICNSEMVRNDILRHYDVAPDRLHVIENAIEVAAYQRPRDWELHRRRTRGEAGIPQEVFLWLFVGSGFARKGLDIVFRALVHHHDAHVAVVGRDHAEARYRRLARRLKIEHRVHFLGRRDDVRPYYWAADALIHPALYEAYGLVVLEAMAAGLPVLGSFQCGAAHALISEGRNGYLRDALDLPGWVDAMERTQAADPGAFASAALTAARQRSLPRLRSEVRSFVDRLLLGAA